MPPPSFPSHLLALLASPSTSSEQATDALEEWILHRRAKGETLFEVSVGLVELEDRSPPNLSYAFQLCRYVTQVPQPSDLTPPMGPFPLARSASPSTILNHLLSSPPPSIEHSREVILEYVLAREMKLREKKPGRGGKGTLGRDGFEEIGKRLSEIEDGLRGGSGAIGMGTSADGAAGGGSFSSPHSTKSIGGGGQELDEARQIGLTLILSLRMSLSYFTLQELASQLMELALSDAERTIVQHVRRRVQGEGRWGVGKELEYVESLTIPRRPALRPAFRAAKARTNLPLNPTYPIALPAPSKSACIKLLLAFARDVESGAQFPNSSFTSPGQNIASLPSPGYNSFSPGGEKGFFAFSKSTNSPTASPKTPLSSLPTPLSAGLGSQARQAQDGNSLASYMLELLSEYLTREKREYMLKNKWVKSGRDSLSKDLGDIESSLCLAGRNTPSQNASILLPTFLILRRTFALPKSPLPASIIEPYLDILPAPPDPDEVPFREPTVGSITAALYVNPRLEDDRAFEVLDELVESEKEKVEAAGGNREELIDWISGLVDSVEKRFPDGSYSAVFSLAKEQIAKPPQIPRGMPAATPMPVAKQPSLHRRALSTAVVSTSASPIPASKPQPSTLLIPSHAPARRNSHSRSVSMPMRSNSYDDPSDDSDSDDSSAQVQTANTGNKETPLPNMPMPPKLAPLEFLSPTESTSDAGLSSAASGGGWWDVVSAVNTENPNPVPWLDNGQTTGMNKHDSSSSGNSFNIHLPLPPGASPAQFTPPTNAMSEMDLESPPQLAYRASPSPPRVLKSGGTPGASPSIRKMSAPATKDTDADTRDIELASPPRRAFTMGPDTPSPSKLGQTSSSRPSLLDDSDVDIHGSGGYKSQGLKNVGGNMSFSGRGDNNRLPPPLPLKFDRPGFPSPQRSPITKLAGEGGVSESPHTSAPSTPRSISFNLPAARNQSSISSPSTAVPPNPNLGSATSSPQTISTIGTTSTAKDGIHPPSSSLFYSSTPPPPPPVVPTQTQPTQAAPPKSRKLGSFGRSMSMAGKSVIGKSKDKGEKSGKDSEKENSGGKVQNNPGKWNRDMVAGIMGPPAERR